jgi:NADH-quinone oxidoreductase subunit L
MVTHAFFKALLFLGAGSVIHGMHDEQDMKKMGALRKWMPITAGTFIIAWLAIAGVPPFAGFWSKDDILAAAIHKSVILWAIGFVTAGLTAYYMTRQVALVFFGKGRWEGADVSEAQARARAQTGEPAAIAGHDDLPAHGEHGALPHESPPTMLLPLVVLALLSVLGGLVNLPWAPLNFLEKWLDPVLGSFSVAHGVSSSTKVGLAVGTTLLVVVAIVAAFRVWSARADNPQLEPAPMRNAWYVDSTYAALIARPGEAVSNFSAYIVDKGIIDGAVNGIATLVRSGGGQLRRLQTGFVRNYALAIAGGTVVLLAYVLVRAS